MGDRNLPPGNTAPFNETYPANTLEGCRTHVTVSHMCCIGRCFPHEVLGVPGLAWRHSKVNWKFRFLGGKGGGIWQKEEGRWCMSLSRLHCSVGTRHFIPAMHSRNWVELCSIWPRADLFMTMFTGVFASRSNARLRPALKANSPIIKTGPSVD
jgi:hypothetical protein